MVLRLILVIIVSLSLLQAVSPASYIADELSFTQGAMAEIHLGQFKCSEIEILRYENLPVETQKGISETSSQSQTEQTKTEKTESAYEWSADNKITSTNSTEDSLKQTGSQPALNVKEDTKFFYKEVPFKVIGATRKQCPASFPIKITAEPGYYYIPVRLYSYEKSAEPDIRYIGVEILPAVLENITANQTGVVEEQRNNEHRDLFILQFVTLLLSLITTLLWVFAVFFRKRQRHEK